MKRKSSLLLILGLLILSLVACTAPKKDKDEDNGSTSEVENPSGNDKEPEDDKEDITITVQVEEDSKAYYEKAAIRLKEKYPGVNIEFIETTNKEHLDLLNEVSPEDERVADLFTIPLNRLYNMEKKYKLSEIDTKAIEENLKTSSSYKEESVNQFQVDEKYMAFPLNIKTMLNFINTENTKTNNIDILRDIEFTELSNEDILIPIFDIWYGITFMNAANIELLTKVEEDVFYSDLTKDFSELTAFQEEIFQAMYNYWYYSREEGSLLFSKDQYLNFMDNSFKTGGNTSIRTSDIESRQDLSELTGANMEIIPLEKLLVMGKPLLQWKDGEGLAINSRIEDDKEKKKIVEAMIEEIANPKYAIHFFQETGKILENTSLETYIKSDLDENDKTFIETAYKSYEGSLERPLLKECEKVSASWEKAILSWDDFNPPNVEEAYKILQNEFKQMLNSIK